MRLIFSGLILVSSLLGVHIGYGKMPKPAAVLTEQADTPVAARPIYRSTDKSRVMSVLLTAGRAKNNEILFTVKNVIVAKGYYKNAAAKAASTTGKFKARFTDINGAGIDSVYFNDPLKKEIEYVGENGKLARRTVNREKETAFVRVNYNANTAMLEIYDTNGRRVSTLNLEKFIKE